MLTPSIIANSSNNHKINNNHNNNNNGSVCRKPNGSAAVTTSTMSIEDLEEREKYGKPKTSWLSTLGGNRRWGLVDSRRRVRKRRHKQSTDVTFAHQLLSVLGILSALWLIWHLVQSTLQDKRLRVILQQRQRAQEIVRNRLRYLPHLDRSGEHAAAVPEQHHDTAITITTNDTPLTLPAQFADARSRQAVDKTLVVRWLAQDDQETLNNTAGGVRWIRPYLLPPVGPQGAPEHPTAQRLDEMTKKKFFRTFRSGQRFAWQDEWEIMKQNAANDPDSLKPIVDYTNHSKYVYPEITDTPPPFPQYPVLKPLRDLMTNWPQDEDYHGVIHETLFHFNYSDPVQRAQAERFRDAELPFKVYDVPELIQASKKWTDDYVARHFNIRARVRRPDLSLFSNNEPKDDEPDMPAASGVAQESTNNYFAFFSPQNWDVMSMGLPPIRNNDWDFATWVEHAKYADAKRLSFDQPHFYWQSGVDREERHRPRDRWTFISRDLPSFSSPDATFFVFHPEEQKGIQCRFGERGVVAATHYDGGRNNVGMITGAKRYILSPPRECSRLGIFTHRKSSIYRHSLLNFAHIKYLNNNNDTGNDGTPIADGMSPEERAWLERAGQADSLETVLKAGEVLYIPSHWFHYIVSLQKSAQCNVRAGIDNNEHEYFGGRETVEQCQDWRGPR